jgi:hypothetical protein
LGQSGEECLFPRLFPFPPPPPLAPTAGFGGILCGGDLGSGRVEWSGNHGITIAEGQPLLNWVVRHFLGTIMIKAFLVAIVSEVSFLIGIFIGSIVSLFAGLVAITAIRGSGQFSVARALLQGAICGLVAGTAGFWVAAMLGRSLSLPDQWLLWIAVVPPIVGEFGHFLNRFSLRHRGKPDTGVFVPLGRLHAAAWAPFRRAIYTLGLEIFRENDPDDIPLLAVRKADWFLGWVILGCVVGVAVSMWWLASVLNVSTV